MTIAAVRVHRFTDPETLRIERIAAPGPEPSSAVVRVEVASVNPVDWKTAEGKYALVGEDKLPIVLGRDLAGTIVEVGSDLDGWSAGDRVCAFIDQARGAHADQVLVTAGELGCEPKKVARLVGG